MQVRFVMENFPRARAARLGASARTRAAAEYLGDRHLEQYGQVFARL